MNISDGQTAPSRHVRIAHLTVYRDLPDGIRKQLSAEHNATRAIIGADWTTRAIHGGAARTGFERRIPMPFRAIMLRNLYGWIIARRLARTHDVVLLRHMPFDPFVFFFAPFIRNRVSVHHSKEVEELPLIRTGVKGRFAARLETYTGRAAVRYAIGVLGVTGEIAQHQVNTRAQGKPWSVYANGIDLDSVPPLADNRSGGIVQIAFICNTFSAWHGLDRLMAAVAKAPPMFGAFVIHLIGTLSDTQRAEINAMGPQAHLFRIHGHLTTVAYRTLLAECDVGLGSLAMDRQNLREGTTLKVREMLAMGLPVYSGHKDAALPNDFAYYAHRRTVDIDDLCEFARTMKPHNRLDVRQAAAPYIEKAAAMQNVVEWCRTLIPAHTAGADFSPPPQHHHAAEG